MLLFFKLLIFIFALGLRCSAWAFSTCRQWGLGGGSFLVAAHGLLIAMASLVAEHRLWAQGLQ